LGDERDSWNGVTSQVNGRKGGGTEMSQTNGTRAEDLEKKVTIPNPERVLILKQCNPGKKRG